MCIRSCRSEGCYCACMAFSDLSSEAAQRFAFVTAKINVKATISVCILWCRPACCHGLSHGALLHVLWSLHLKDYAGVDKPFNQSINQNARPAMPMAKQT